MNTIHANDEGSTGTSASKGFKSLGLKLALILLAVFWLVVIAASWAESAEAATDAVSAGSGATTDLSEGVTNRAPASADSAAPDSNSSDYNFNWLDPEKKIYVLQNRRYTKAGHVFLHLMGGPGLSNSYRTTWNLDPRLSYYFSEDFGLEAFYTATFNSPNNTFNALAATSPTTMPVIREFKSEEGIMAQWVPWYAKINVFNKILYFDWYLNVGMGQVDTQINLQTNNTLPASWQDQKLFAMYLGTGHIYHISEDWTVRLDFTGDYYHAPLQGNAGNNTWYSNFNFEIGFGYRL